MGEEVLNEQERLVKNNHIKERGKATRKRHKKMACKTYELKIDESHLTKETQDVLRRLFLEAKWFYNHLIAQGEVWDANYDVKSVLVRNKDKLFESRDLTVLSSQMRQELIARAKDNIVGLSVLKKNGHKVGALGFKKEVNSIPLIQYGVTFDIIGDKVRVQNVKQLMRVRGLGQIPVTKKTEVATALLIHRESDYFINLTVYQEQIQPSFPKKGLGIDGGIQHQLNFSNRVEIDEGVPITKKIRRLHRELSNREKLVNGKHSKNWFKTNLKLNKAYQRLSSQRIDIRHKIVSKTISTYETIAVQDDNIAGWQTMWGRRVQMSAIGGIMRDLRNKAHTPILVDRWTASTQTCSKCGVLNPEMKDLSKRTFECEGCGFRTDRNWNASKNDWKQIPVERRESTPLDTKVSTEMVGYFNSIPHVKASLVETSPSDAQLLGERIEEAASREGSHPTLVGG